MEKETKGETMQQKHMIAAIVIVAVIVLGTGGSFAAGVKYQQLKQKIAVRQFGTRQQGGMMGAQGTIPQGGQRGGAGGGRMGNQVVGTIKSQDDKSITVQLPDGSSKIVLISTNTTFNKSVEATKVDLKEGQTVMIFGTTNTDGTVTAQTVQLNAMVKAIEKTLQK